MKIRRFIAITGLFSFLTIMWLALNIRYLTSSTFESLFWMNNTAFGYSSIMAYCLFYTLPFIMFLDYFFIADSAFTIVRWTKRQKLFSNIVKRIIITSFIFSVLHTVVNLGLTYLFHGYQLIKETQFLFISMSNLIVIFLFYLWVGLIYRLLYDLYNSFSLSTIVTFIAIGLMFFVEKLFIPNDVWNPMKDLVTYQFLLEQKWTILDVILVYFRQFSIGVVIFLIGSSSFIRKDFI